ncbi:MAG: hypothetical protein M3N95_17195 [Actinomycetota bacterium]|nr:hypothetical protein [Actinomycetota bacterium]
MPTDRRSQRALRLLKATDLGTTQAGQARAHVILRYCVNDIGAAITRVRSAGGQARDVMHRPYGPESPRTDDQATWFYLHQLSSL